MKKVLHVSLPLSTAVMSEFFKDKANIAFVVDFGESVKTLQSQQAVLNYIANLKLDVVELVNCEITCDLLHAFATMRELCTITPLSRVLANVLYFCKYGDVLDPEGLPVFGYDKIVEYVTAHHKVILIQAAFLNSVPLFVSVSHDRGLGQEVSELDYIKQTDNAVRSEISSNLLSLFTLDNFLIHYLEQTVSLDAQIYFEPHFERNIYQGKSMLGMFAVPENTYFLMCSHITDSLKSDDGRVELVEWYDSLLEGTKAIEDASTLADLAQDPS